LGFKSGTVITMKQQTAMMEAVVMQQPGGASVLQRKKMPVPGISYDTDVLVRLRAAGLNPVDAKLRQNPGSYSMPLPVVLGFDGAGVVEATGKTVTRFAPGDEVYFCHPSFGGRSGCYAAYTVVPEILLAHKPVRLSFAEAAAVPLALITAWESLFDRANVQAGHKVLVHGGAGGVGHLAIQLAKHAGAAVCTTVSSESKARFVSSLGADEHINYRDEDFAQAVLRWTGGRGVEVALDTVGGQTFEHTFAAVRYGGQVVTLLQPPSGTNWGIARQRNLGIGLELMLSPTYLGIAPAQRAQSHILEACAPRFDDGGLRVSVAHTYPLNEVVQAHQELESGTRAGKLVLEID
jgi:NADPH2:quinone reductase